MALWLIWVLHGLLPLLAGSLDLILKYIQVIAHRFGKLPVVTAAGVAGVPFGTVSVSPDVLALAPYVGKAEPKRIHLTVVTVQDGKLERFVMVRNTTGGKLDLCPLHFVQADIAGPAYISGFGISGAYDLAKFLLKESQLDHLR